MSEDKSTTEDKPRKLPKGFGGKQANAGRKKASHTIASEALRKYIINEVIKVKKPLIKKIIDGALAGNEKNQEQLLERVLGRPITPLDHQGEGLEALTNAITTILTKK